MFMYQVCDFINGYNSSVIVYGQTGTLNNMKFSSLLWIWFWFLRHFHSDFYSYFHFSSVCSIYISVEYNTVLYNNFEAKLLIHLRTYVLTYVLTSPLTGSRKLILEIYHDFILYDIWYVINISIIYYSYFNSTYVLTR